MNSQKMNTEREPIDLVLNEIIVNVWETLVDTAIQYGRGSGPLSQRTYLQRAYKSYLSLSEVVGGYSMGGQKGSQFNRDVLAGRILDEIDGVGSGHPLNEAQLSRLKTALEDISQRPMKNINA